MQVAKSANKSSLSNSSGVNPEWHAIKAQKKLPVPLFSLETMKKLELRDSRQAKLSTSIFEVIFDPF